MEYINELVTYINQSREYGMNEVVIVKKLLEQGWKAEDIDMAIKLASDQQNEVQEQVKIPPQVTAGAALKKTKRRSGENDFIWLVAVLFIICVVGASSMWSLAFSVAVFVVAGYFAASIRSLVRGDGRAVEHLMHGILCLCVVFVILVVGARILR